MGKSKASGKGGAKSRKAAGDPAPPAHPAPPTPPAGGLIRDRVKEFRRVRAGDLAPHPQNWRTHTPAQAEAFRKIAAEVGFAGAVLARELGDGTLQLIDGHLRTEVVDPAAEVPVLVLDVSEEEAAKLLATYDPLGAMAGRDAERLAGLLAELKAGGDELAAAVWPDYVIDPLLSADWKPEPVGELPTRDHAPKGRHVELTPEQAEVWDQARAHARGEMGAPEATDGDVLRWVCERYLSDGGGE